MATVAFLRERCAVCDEIVEFAPPERWGWSYNPVTGESSLLFFPDKAPLCIRCALAHGQAELKSQLIGTIKQVMRRKREIGLPPDMTLFVTTSHPAADSPDRLNDIRFTQYVAFYRGQVPPDSKVPGLWYRSQYEGTLPFPTGQPFGMLWFGWDTSTEDGSVAARFTWSADDWSREGTLMIDGWSSTSTASLSRLLHASEDFMLKTRGRPKGVTDYALQDYQRTFRLCYERSRRRPLIAEVASELRQDRGTVTDNLKRWGYRDYRDFAEQMMRDE